MFDYDFNYTISYSAQHLLHQLNEKKKKKIQIKFHNFEMQIKKKKMFLTHCIWYYREAVDLVS